jgi:hypothetical protein
MNMNDENHFITKDIYLASTLIATGNTWYSLEKQGKIFYFTFDKRQSQENIEAEVDNYWARNLLVDPRALFDAFQELKTRMYSEENEYGNKIHPNTK